LSGGGVILDKLIQANSWIMVGKPVIKSTRITAEGILERRAGGERGLRGIWRQRGPGFLFSGTPSTTYSMAETSADDGSAWEHAL
jgi:hypothetical protein